MIALRYGTIPVVRETGGLKDSITDSGDGQGNGLHPSRRTTPGICSTPCTGPSTPTTPTKRAGACWWTAAMGCDNSWGKSANEYIKLYKQICKD